MMRHTGCSGADRADVHFAREVARERERSPAGFGVRLPGTDRWLCNADLGIRHPGREDWRARFGTAAEALAALRTAGPQGAGWVVCGILD